MTIRSFTAFPRARLAALATAVGLCALCAGPARAQWFHWPNWDDALSPVQVERMVEASGYRLTAPVLRTGPVYLANVLGRDDDPERLVIDARDGRLLQRYAASPGGRQLAAAHDWAKRQRDDADAEDGWADSDDRAPPRPPGAIYGGDGAARLSLPLPAPRVEGSQGGQIARGDESSLPHVILAPPGATPDLTGDKPRPKPQARRKKPDTTPVAQPSVNPAAPAPQKSDAAVEAAPVAPRLAETKAPATAAAAPEVASPAPGPAAAPPRNAKSTPNDVPVAPLE
jgi:hypothetical protein